MNSRIYNSIPYCNMLKHFYFQGNSNVINNGQLHNNVQNNSRNVEKINTQQEKHDVVNILQVGFYTPLFFKLMKLND